MKRIVDIGTTEEPKDRRAAANRRLAKVAVQCSTDPEFSGWLITHWFSASIPRAIGMVKIATFAKRQNVTCECSRRHNIIDILELLPVVERKANKSNS